MGLIAIFSIFLIMSCATTSNTLSSEFKDNIKEITIVVEHEGDNLQILDHTNVMNSQINTGQLGVMPVLLEQAILGTAANSRINKSIGGDPDLLKNTIGNIQIDDMVYEYVKNRIIKRYKIVDARKLNIKKDHDNLEIPPDRINNEATLDNYNLEGLDTFIRIRFIYGLAAYIGEPASADIDADVEIWDAHTKKRLVKERILSDYLFKSGHTIYEFSDEDARLFKEDINKAADSLGLQIAATFGIDVAERDSKVVVVDTYDSTYMTCSRPYKFSQDCSNWSGAKREIELQGHKMRISGSEDGKSILIMDEKYFSNSLKRALSMGISDAGTDEAMECGRAVESFFADQKIHIIKKLKLIETGSVVGFVMEMEGDGYSLLKNHTVENN